MAHGKLEKVSLSSWGGYPYFADYKTHISLTKGDLYAYAQSNTNDRNRQVGDRV